MNAEFIVVLYRSNEIVAVIPLCVLPGVDWRLRFGDASGVATPAAASEPSAAMAAVGDITIIMLWTSRSVTLYPMSRQTRRRSCAVMCPFPSRSTALHPCW